MPDTPDRLKATLADRYALQREQGRGGMATVYFAEDLKHDRKVAIKVLRPELAAVLGAERFDREVNHRRRRLAADRWNGPTTEAPGMTRRFSVRGGGLGVSDR